MSQLPDRVVSQAFQEIFFYLSERNVCRAVLLSDKSIQVLANSVVTSHSRSLYFDAHLLLHLLDHSVVSFQKGDLSLHTSLELLFNLCRCKDNPSLTKNPISRLYREKQAFQQLAIQSALTSIPQLGGARQLTTELGDGSTMGYRPHYRSLPRLVQSALFQVEQNLHFVFFHTLLFYG